MTSRTQALNDELYDYIITNSLREAPILTQLRVETAKLSNHKMQISPEQGQFMAFLVELISARKALELGVYTGYSALAVALALPDDGKIVACDINEEWTNIGKPYWREAGVEPK